MGLHNNQGEGNLELRKSEGVKPAPMDRRQDRAMLISEDSGEQRGLERADMLA